MDATHPYRAAVAANLRAEKGRQRQTNTALARSTGWPAKTVSHRMSGNAPLDVDDLATLARAFGKSPIDFLPDEPPAESRSALSA